MKRLDKLSFCYRVYLSYFDETNDSRIEEKRSPSGRVSRKKIDLSSPVLTYPFRQSFILFPPDDNATRKDSYTYKIRLQGNVSPVNARVKHFSRSERGASATRMPRAERHAYTDGINELWTPTRRPGPCFDAGSPPRCFCIKKQSK